MKMQTMHDLQAPGKVPQALSFAVLYISKRRLCPVKSHLPVPVFCPVTHIMDLYRCSLFLILIYTTLNSTTAPFKKKYVTMGQISKRSWFLFRHQE